MPWSDLKYAARMMRKAPGVTLAAVASLALGIGANTTIFSWIDAVLLRPLPGVADSGHLLEVWGEDEAEGIVKTSYPDYLDLRDGSRSLAGLTVFEDYPVSLSADGQTDRVWGMLVSGDHFEVLGVRADLGRALTPADDVPGSDPVVVLSHGLWQRRFGGDPGIVGRSVALNRQPFTVVGVAPPEFRGARMALSFDVWVPLAHQVALTRKPERLERRDDRWLWALARVEPGVSLQQARADVARIAERVAREFPDTNRGRTVSLWPLAETRGRFARAMGQMLVLLAAVVALVLLIACANIANLLLARATVRRREIWIRSSLGASRGRLVRQMLVESALLALAGGGAGVLVAVWGTGILGAFVPPSEYPVQFEVQVAGRALAFTLAASVLTGLLFGLVPALQASRPQIAAALRDEAGSLGGSRRASRLRGALVSGQMGLSLLLLFCAGLVVRGLREAQSLPLGFEPRGVLVAGLDPVNAGYDGARARLRLAEVLERVRGLPSVEAATLGRRIPLGHGGSTSLRGFRVAGYAPAPGEDTLAFVNQVGPDYFRTLRVPLRAGRDLGTQDAGDAPAVVVVNETMASRYWSGREAVGGRLQIEGRSFDVVGVAADMKFRKLDEPPAPMVFLPTLQGEPSEVSLHVRVAGDPLGSAPGVLAAVRSVDPTLAVFALRTLEESTAAATASQRFAGALLGAFGVLALLLAAVGLYGVVAYAVGQRTREIGIRMALGSARRAVFTLVLRQGLTPVALGIAVGLGASLAVARPLAGVLPGVSAGNPWTLAGVVALLSLVSLLACAIPARRATRVDPMLALRCE